MADKKISKNIAREQLMRASHGHWGKAERTLQDRARDLDDDVTPEELDNLLNPWK
jgi:hypothetical protein